jgi:Predicted membrane protein (DUF2157)
MPDLHTAPDLYDLLGRWVADGLIDTGQAERIEAAEAARLSPASSGQAAAARPASGPGQRRALAVEALGYLGGALVLVAGFIAVGQLWPDITTNAELAFAAGGAIALLVAGAAIRTDDPPLGRLRSVLWLMSTASLAAFMGVLAAQVWDFGGISAALVMAAASTVYATALWWRTRVPLQHLVLFASAAVLVGTGIAWAGPGLEAWGPGFGVWGLSVLWAIAVYRGYLVPRDIGYLAVAIGLLVGAQMTMAMAAGQALALVTVAGLLVAGVALRRVALLGLGAVGVIITVPQTATRYLPESFGAPLAVLIVGLVLLGMALWLAKARKRSASAGAAGDGTAGGAEDGR